LESFSCYKHNKKLIIFIKMTFFNTSNRQLFIFIYLTHFPRYLIILFSEKKKKIKNIYHLKNLKNFFPLIFKGKKILRELKNY
jgi:hypothetical protein